jgi:hypothetical protein
MAEALLSINQSATLRFPPAAAFFHFGASGYDSLKDGGKHEHNRPIAFGLCHCSGCVDEPRVLRQEELGRERHQHVSAGDGRLLDRAHGSQGSAHHGSGDIDDPFPAGDPAFFRSRSNRHPGRGRGAHRGHPDRREPHLRLGRCVGRFEHQLLPPGVHRFRECRRGRAGQRSRSRGLPHGRFHGTRSPHPLHRSLYRLTGRRRSP